MIVIVRLADDVFVHWWTVLFNYHSRRWERIALRAQNGKDGDSYQEMIQVVWSMRSRVSSLPSIPDDPLVVRSAHSQVRCPIA